MFFSLLSSLPLSLCSLYLLFNTKTPTLSLSLTRARPQWSVCTTSRDGNRPNRSQSVLGRFKMCRSESIMVVMFDHFFHLLIMVRWGRSKICKSKLMIVVGQMVNVILSFHCIDGIPHICHRRHWRCLCKNFLSGVNFSRLSEKNAYI